MAKEKAFATHTTARLRIGLTGFVAGDKDIDQVVLGHAGFDGSVRLWRGLSTGNCTLSLSLSFCVYVFCTLYCSVNFRCFFLSLLSSVYWSV
jgi:hypothetical protein